jgi:hypothetical protein
VSARTLRGRVAIAGIGESRYYPRGKSPDPEFVLALKAILAACEDAAIDPRQIDGFASYANDRNEPARLAAALGISELRLANMQWGAGGAGGSAAVGNAAAAVAAGLASCVVVFRALAQGQFGRFGSGQRSACCPPLRCSRCAPSACFTSAACHAKPFAPWRSPPTITRSETRAP